MVERVAELPRVRKEVRLLEGVLGHESATDDPIAEAHRLRQVAANSARGTSPRNRYMGLASEPPPVSSRASSAPSASRSRAAATLSSSHNPPGTPSTIVELRGDGDLSPTASRTARTTWRGKRGRASISPPHWSLRRLKLGAEERAEQVVVAEVDLDGVEAGIGEHPCA